MVFHQNIYVNTKFGYSLIIIDHQIDEKSSNFDQKSLQHYNNTYIDFNYNDITYNDNTYTT